MQQEKWRQKSQKERRQVLESYSSLQGKKARKEPENFGRFSFEKAKNERIKEKEYNTLESEDARDRRTRTSWVECYAGHEKEEEEASLSKKTRITAPTKLKMKVERHDGMKMQPENAFERENVFESRERGQTRQWHEGHPPFSYTQRVSRIIAHSTSWATLSITQHEKKGRNQLSCHFP